MGKKIPPFWKQPNKFFMYPLQKPVIIYTLAVAFISYFCLWVVLPSDWNDISAIYNSILFIAVIVLITAFAIARYAFKIAALASLGVFDLENHDTRDEEAEWKSLPWKFVGVVFLQSLFFGFVMQFMPGDATVIREVSSFLISLAMPAVVMVLIQKMSVMAALNPMELARTITGIGWPYLLLYGFIHLLNLSSGIAFGFLAGMIPWVLLVPGFIIVVSYFYFVNMAMIGYTMYQYHRTLDFDVIHDYEENQPQPTSPREIARQRDAEVAELIQNGETEEALLQAQDWLEEAPESLAEHRRYHRVLRLTGTPEALQKHGHEYIALLQKKQSTSEALKVYKTCLTKAPDFALNSAVASISLAKTAFKQQEHDLALKMLRGFDKRFAQHPLIPAAFGLIVRILHQGLQQESQAQAVFNSLQRAYPNDPNTQEAARLLQNK